MAEVSTQINVLDQEELIERVSKKCRFSEADIDYIWSLMVQELQFAIQRGEEVELRGNIQILFDNIDSK